MSDAATWRRIADRMGHYDGMLKPGIHTAIGTVLTLFAEVIAQEFERAEQDEAAKPREMHAPQAW